ncbi:MAG: hypothetical protein M3Q08_15375, partial [Pseudomonadota bacterium]|nr:hypothetical protein [Pseudomonadota bacterium]
MLFVGMSGAGKTVASQLYVEHCRLPTMWVELQPGATQDWHVLRPALAALGLPARCLNAALRAMSAPVVLVLDRFEAGLAVDGTLSTAVQSWLPTMLRHPLVHIVIASRFFPSDPTLTAMLGAGTMRVVDGAVLAFTAAEIQALWAQRQGQALDARRAELLHRYSGGIAAIVSVASVLNWTPEQPRPAVVVAAAHDLLRVLPQPLSDLVIDLAVMDELDAAMVAAVVERHDGTQLLRMLQQYGVLQEGAALRLHPLVRHVAREQLLADQQRFAHASGRAVSHARSTGQLALAWQLASAARLHHLAYDIILAAAPQLRAEGAAQTVIDWIKTLPGAMVDHELTVMLARCQADIGDLDGAVLTLCALQSASTDPMKLRDATIWLAIMIQARGEVRSADGLVQPYLADPSLPVLLQARVFRIHAIACALAGDGSRGLEYIERCIAAAHASGQSRLLALAYGDQANMAGRMGRLAEAERALRLAERCWRELDSIAELSITLNARAMLKLAQGDHDHAFALAQEARAHASRGGRLREAAVASATAGDVLLGQGDYTAARQHYLVAIEDSERSGYLALRGYCLALQAHTARLRQARQEASALLDQLSHHLPESLENAGWRISGIVAAQLTIGRPAMIPDLQQVLAQVGDELVDVKAALLALLAQAFWHASVPAQALEAWHALEQLLATPKGRGSRRLARLALAEPALVRAAAADDAAPIAQRLLSMTVAEPVPIPPVAHRPATECALRIQVFGTTEHIWWHGVPAKVPDRALALLVVLLQADHPLSQDELLSLVWPGEPVGSHALDKLVVRLRAVMPGAIRRSGRSFSFTLHRSDVDADFLSFF